MIKLGGRSGFAPSSLELVAREAEDGVRSREK
jgi:hypothetical protein